MARGKSRKKEIGNGRMGRKISKGDVRRGE
jgi:hypothetical protein